MMMRDEKDNVVFMWGDDRGIFITQDPYDYELNFCCHDDWCGDSETGFGESVTIALSRKDVVNLVEKLSEWIESTEK